MKQNIIVAGCRDYTDYEEARSFIEESLSSFGVRCSPVLLCGKCRGADELGERYAREKGWEIRYFPADWLRHGKAAGPIRNKEMVDAADFVICFWDGKSRGTASLVQYAKKAGLPLAIKKI